jgi:hypothetical protein
MSNIPIFAGTAARVAQWRVQPEVVGVLLVGSKSRGHADVLSDDDLEVLLTDEAFAQRVPTDCIELLEEGERPQQKLIYDAQYTSFSELKLKLSSPLDMDHWPYERARVLFDRHGNVVATVQSVGQMDADFRRLRLLYSTLNTSIAIGRATKTLKRGYEGAGRLIIARGVKNLSRLLFALEWRWVPLDHWLENELRTLADPTQSGGLLIEALTSGSSVPLREALTRLEDLLAEEGVPRPVQRTALFCELIHPSRTAERAIHGMY